MDDIYNTEMIMEEIRKEIEKKGYQESELKSFQEMQFHLDTVYEDMYEAELFEQNLAAMNRDYLLSLEHTLDSNPLKRFIQKIVIKLIRFYIEPVVNQQITYNMDIVHVMNQTRLYHRQVGRDIEDIATEQKEDILRMMRHIQELERQLVQANNRIKSLEEKQEG